MRKEQIAIIVLTLWLTIISAFMILLKRVDFEIFFIIFLLGILIIVQFVEPKYVQPIYLQYIRIIIAVGILIFIVIVVQKVMEILGLEIVFY